MEAFAALEDQILSEIRQMVLPQRFPPRRDLEVAGALCEAPPRRASAFFDVFWPREGLLAAVVGRVGEGGLEGALRASSLQRLCRAALGFLAPERAEPLVAELYGRQFPGGGFDVVLVTLEAETGACRTARRGAAGVEGRRAVPAEDFTARPGEVVWLAAGNLAAPAAGGGLADGVEDRVRAAAAADGAKGAVLAIDVKARSGGGGGRQSLTMANDIGAISGLVGRVEALLGTRGVPEAVGSAFGLSLDEVLTNVVSYGFADGGRHEILIDIAVEPAAVEICVRDDGRPFDPLSVAVPDLEGDLEERQIGGLGIHFVRTLLDGLEYRRDKGWNILTLRKEYDPDCDGKSSGG